MKERPILFSGEMVRAVLDGSKTKTRRVIKRQPGGGVDGCYNRPDGLWIWLACGGDQRESNTACGAGVGISPLFACPYGMPGDRLWVRECFADIPETAPGNMHYRASATAADLEWFKDEGWKWRPSIHMPRWASRITLEIVSVKVERLQDITEGDMIAEGIDAPQQIRSLEQAVELNSKWKKLWDSVAKDGFGWVDNPWVWVVEFKRI